MKLIGRTFRDISYYGRGGKYGTAVRVLTIVKRLGPGRVQCVSKWVRGRANPPERRVAIQLKALLGRGYQELYGYKLKSWEAPR